MLSESTRVIDVPISDLFTKFDQNTDQKLSRKQLQQFLNNVFIKMKVNKRVTEQDVNNFLLDYSIVHPGLLTKQDFNGISKLKFFLNTKLIQQQVINNSDSIKQRGGHKHVSIINMLPKIQSYKTIEFGQVPTQISIQQNKLPAPQIRKIIPVNQYMVKRNFQTSKIQRRIQNKFKSDTILTKKVIIPVQMIFDIFAKSQKRTLNLNQIRQVLILIFRDFGINYMPTQKDVINFLKDFDINFNHQLTQSDFKDKNTLIFRYEENVK